MGNGVCNSGYYAGWDDKGTANQDACNLLCLSEKQCTFAAYFDDGHRKTCSRYKDEICILDASSDYKKAYATYYKDLGAEGIFNFFIVIMYIDYYKFWTARFWALNFGEILKISNDFENKFLDF